MTRSGIFTSTSYSVLRDKTPVSCVSMVSFTNITLYMCAGKVFIQQENLATLQKETFFNIHSKTKCRWLTMVSIPNISSPESDHKGWEFYLKVHLWPWCKEHILPGFSGQGTGNCVNATTEESIVHFKFKRGCTVDKGCQEWPGYCQTANIFHSVIWFELQEILRESCGNADLSS